MTFSFESFVTEARAAANTAEPTKSIRRLMETTLRNPADLVATNPLAKDEEDVLLFEDDSVSIWVVRFDPEVVVPPHEHKMNAFIGVFQGSEKNIFFKKQDNALKYMSTKTLETGQVLSIGSDGLHSVVADGYQPCCSLHVYTGPLSKIKRSIFDWESGEDIEFTDENYQRMKRRLSDLNYPV